jgi:hypothetical protein
MVTTLMCALMASGCATLSLERVVEAHAAGTCAAANHHGKDFDSQLLLDWLTDGKYAEQALQPHTEEADQPIQLARVQGFGMSALAARDIRDQETVLQVPRRLWVSRGLAKGTFAAAVVEQLHERAGLAALLMAMIGSMELCDDTFASFRPYLLSLPNRTSMETCYLLWSQDDKALLWGHGGDWHERHATAAYKAFMEADAASGNAGLCLRLPAGFCTEERYRYMMCLVVSRAFSAPADFDDTMVLIPGLDLLNHNSIVQTSKRHGGEELIANKAIAKGEQIFNDYGQHASMHQLMTYGFISSSVNDASFDHSIDMVVEEGDTQKTQLLERLKLSGIHPEQHDSADGRYAFKFTVTACGVQQKCMEVLRVLCLGPEDDPAHAVTGKPVSRANELRVYSAIEQSMKATIHSHSSILANGNQQRGLQSSNAAAALMLSRLVQQLAEAVLFQVEALTSQLRLHEEKATFGKQGFSTGTPTEHLPPGLWLQGCIKCNCGALECDSIVDQHWSKSKKDPKKKKRKIRI